MTLFAFDALFCELCVVNIVIPELASKYDFDSDKVFVTYV